MTVAEYMGTCFWSQTAVCIARALDADVGSVQAELDALVEAGSVARVSGHGMVVYRGNFWGDKKPPKEQLEVGFPD